MKILVTKSGISLFFLHKEAKKGYQYFFIKPVIFILFFLMTAKPVEAQTTIGCSNSTITFDMVTANALVATGSGTPKITNWGSVTTPFSWETNGTATLNALASTVHVGVSGTNVFYGSNDNIPADLISRQPFNLYRGPITLSGKFFNLSTSNKYDESYLSIIPSTYTTAVPVGQAGAVAVNSRVGISVGGSVGSGNLTIYDNRDASSSSVSIATAARPAAMTTNTWYTLSATFDIQDGSVVITNVSVNGTSVGFIYPVVIGSSYYPTQNTTQTFTWVSSVRTVASVDDLLDDFTITTNPCYTISGTVFNDANGLTDAIVNGIGINKPATSQLYAVLVDENENIVGSYATVANNGTYSFTSVPGGVFEVRLTNKVPGSADSDAPPASLPAGWINTGENIGASAGNDGSPNGSIVVGPAGAINVNFGIQAYTAASNTFDCSTNAITFDMVSQNAQISNSSNQSATGTNNATTWASITNNFVWEAFATDANIYGTASDIPQHADLTGVSNPSNVFFGGVWQNKDRNNTGQVSADFISKSTYSLSSTSGPTTLIGRFLNKSTYTEENESYLLILPDNYKHFQPLGRYDPPAFGASVQREGIFIGGNISTSLAIFDNLSATAATTVPASLALWGGLAPAPNTWYTLSATFDVQGSNLVVTNVSVNGVTAGFTYPVVIGTVATHSWISSMRVAASADDLMDDFTIATNPCISGNVFNDLNGMGDGIVNGTGINNPSGVQLYVTLINSLNKIVQSVAVASDGTYSMSNVYPGTYTMLVSKNTGSVGSSVPVIALPTGWFYTGENIGLGAGSDGTPNGKIITVPLAGGRTTSASPISTSSTSVLNVDFGIVNGIVPVKLIDFNAARSNDIVLINWVTASEIDNKYFLVEKSSDGLSFQQLAIVNTNGNRNIQASYQVKDLNPFPDKNYYRLKQVDIDGRFTYSNVVSVHMDGISLANYLTVSPNPVVSNNITLNLSATEMTGNSKVYIYDVTGSIVKQYTWFLNKGINKRFITDINTLASGVYIVSVIDANGNYIGRTKFIK